MPKDWLTYAALDVELLVELRDKMYLILKDAKKLPWAIEEFASILKAPPAPPRVDPWRRTSGMHKIKRRDQLAVIKTLWIARDEVAARQDIAPGKLLNDSAIVELAIAVPTNKKEFEKALTYYAKVSPNRLNNSNAEYLNFQIGYSYFALEKWKESITAFKKVVSNKESKYFGPGNYYLGMGYFKEKTTRKRYLLSKP